MSLKLLRQEEQQKRTKALRDRLIALKVRQETETLPQAVRSDSENVLPPSGNRQSVLDNIKSYKQSQRVVVKEETSNEAEQQKKKDAEKIVAVTALLREQVQDVKGDLDKAIHELHAQLFLNSVQRQKMDEIEAKCAHARSELHAQHKAELDHERRKNAQQEKMVDAMAEQMQTIQDMALKKITMLEKKLAEAQAEE